MHDNKKILHNDFVFCQNKYFKNKIMLCKSDKLIINFYQYIGLTLCIQVLQIIIKKTKK